MNKSIEFEKSLREFVASKSKELGLTVNMEDNSRREGWNIIVEDNEEAIFRLNASRLGYKPEWFGRSYRSPLSGRLFKIVGCNKNSSIGYNVLRVRDNLGKVWVTRVHGVEGNFVD